jgi:hypothetical protein
MKLPTVLLYAEPAAPELNTAELASYLREQLPRLRVGVRPSLVASCLEGPPSGEKEAVLSRLAQGFAGLKIRDPMARGQDFPVLPGEVEYERRRLTSPRPTFGLLYHGEGAMHLLRELLPQSERGLAFLHIVFTNQLLGTWGEGRYHLRAAVFGFPSLLSTTGLVEAPAKPREFYVLKQQYAALGMPDAVVELEQDLGERVLRHGDPRLTEVMKGYVMQALFYHATGDPFCEDKGCRLYNAHWQEEVMGAQLKGDYQFCARHQGLLDELREGGLA